MEKLYMNLYKYVQIYVSGNLFIVIIIIICGTLSEIIIYLRTFPDEFSQNPDKNLQIKVTPFPRN